MSGAIFTNTHQTDVSKTLTTNLDVHHLWSGPPTNGVAATIYHQATVIERSAVITDGGIIQFLL